MTKAKDIRRGQTIKVNGRKVTVTRVLDYGRKARRPLHIEYKGGSMSGILTGSYDRDIDTAGNGGK